MDMFCDRMVEELIYKMVLKCVPSNVHTHSLSNLSPVAITSLQSWKPCAVMAFLLACICASYSTTYVFSPVELKVTLNCMDEWAGRQGLF